jgi:hypothetical protein
MCLGQKVINKIFLALLFIYSAHASAANTLFDSTFFTNKTASLASGWWRSGSNLDLDFANNRYYLQGTSYTTIASFITAAGASFTRNSTATYVNSSGDIAIAAVDTPRLTYNSKTLDSQGVLVEESSTNQATYSENFTGTNWSITGAGSVTVSATTSPDGLNNANLVSFNGTTNSYINKTGIPAVSGITVTRSVFVKVASSTQLSFEFTDSTNCANYCRAIFDLSAGTATWSASKAAQGNVFLVPYKNGWYRASATFTYSASGTAANVMYVGCYGSCVSSLYMWGMQVEYSKAMPTSYIPTAAATVTRSADSFKIPIGTWFDTTKGTLISQNYGNLNGNQIGYARVIGLDGAKCPIGLGANGSSGASSWDGITNLTFTSSNFSYPTTTYLKPIKMAVAWDESTTSRSFAGAGSIATGVIAVGSFSTTHVYPGGSAYNPLNAPLIRMTYFPTKQSDTVLKNMTP